MTRTLLTKHEEKVLQGLIKYPALNDSTLSSTIGVKLSTLTSIKRRLREKGYYRKIMVPMLNNFGAEMLAVIHTEFNPVIPLEDRIEKTKKTIEIFDEIFFSVGEQEKGFSISLSQNYTNIGRINDIRTETFGQIGLLEKEYPQEVIFPFDTSRFIRFFDFTRLFTNEDMNHSEESELLDYFKTRQYTQCSNKEKAVYINLVHYPEASTQFIGEKVGLSRHTVSRMRNKFLEQHLLKPLVIPNLELLGFEILSFLHILLNPHTPCYPKDITYLDDPSTIFFASRRFELVLISAYRTYQDYKEDKMHKIRYLKENDFISSTPLFRKYMFNRMVIIKDFDFAAITEKVLPYTTAGI